MEQQSANDGRCYQKGTNLDNCMPKDSEDYEVNQLQYGRGIPCKDEGFGKGEFSLKPCLANYVTFPNFYA